MARAAIRGAGSGMHQLWRTMRFSQRGSFLLLRYIFIGLASNLIFLVISNLVYNQTGNGWQSSLVGGIGSIFVSFMGHGFVTYRSVIRPITVVKFFCLVGWNLMMIQLITYSTHSILRLPYLVTTFIVITIIPFTSFLFSRYYVFSPGSRDRYDVSEPARPER
ncbi:GtrA family protein [Tardiphaga sp. 813_E8_N1_3]|uniref:GtrA family protein n=1 Tax=Tardiphaga sp. 813_E8_N1_3 TaxID=3240760 RepID=UPI003F25DC50